MSGCMQHIEFEYPNNDPNTSIRGERFNQLLNICWPHMDYFTLSCNAVCYDDSCLLKGALRPWFAGTISDRWFLSGKSKRRVYRYRATEGAKEAILASYQDIFLEWTVPRDHYTILQEKLSVLRNLCLFSDGKMFFGSLSRSRIAAIWPLDEEMRRAVSAVGEWEEYEPAGDPWIILDNYDWWNEL